MKTIELVACVTAHVIRREAATLGLCRRELGAQLDELRLIDGMANGILGRGKATGRKLGLHPLGSVRSKFDFHVASFQRTYGSTNGSAFPMAKMSADSSLRKGRTTAKTVAAHTAATNARVAKHRRDFTAARAARGGRS
jgi:hypothetical protein